MPGPVRNPETSLPAEALSIAETIPDPPPFPRSRRVPRSGRGRRVVFFAVTGLLGLSVAGHLAGWRLPQSTLSWDAQASNNSRLAPYDGGTPVCDVLVAGGTPSGIAAALAASRRGAKVLLIEERPHLGGDIVYAMLNMFDVVARPGEASPVHGIFAEFYDQLGMAFSIDRARQLFTDACVIEPNLRTHTRTRLVKVLKEGDRVVGAVLATGHAAHQHFEVRTRVLIDATNDATVAAKAGAGYYIGRENANPDKRMQSAGLLFSVAGVDWKRVRAYVRGKKLIRADERKNRKYAIDVAPAAESKVPIARSKKTPSPLVWLRLGGMTGNYGWERGDVIKDYKPRGRDVLFLSINFGRQADGTVVLNTLNIVNVNGLSAYSRAQARRQAVNELPFFLKYLRGRMPGFEKARLARVAPELYIRETRHIHGHYALKVSDVRTQKRFFDRVAMVSYPLDLHPYQKGDINPFGPQRYYYTVPLRSLVPRRVDGVFVASRSLSATYSAAGSARVIPVTMACGEAAGAAAWLCVRDNITPHKLVVDYPRIDQLHQNLRDWGAEIGDKYPSRQHRPVSSQGETPLLRPELPVYGPPKYQGAHSQFQEISSISTS